MRSAVLAVVVVLLPVSTATWAVENRESVLLVNTLQEKNPEFMIDLHGNVHASLLRLEILRFEATTAVQDGIDRMEGDPARTELVNALYQVLGFVKDPASTSWLERKLGSQQRQAIYDHYLPYWQDHIGLGFGNNEGFGGWRWLTGRDRWISFFIDAHRIEPSPDRRVELMNILKGFDDPAAMEFFMSQSDTARDPREILLVEAYLHQHEMPIDRVRIAAAVDILKKDAGNRDLLIGTADALRNEAFVPYLIDTLDVAAENITPLQYNSQDVLQGTTYQLEIKGKAAWNEWFSKHRNEGRAQWVQSAMNAFKERLARDPADAKAWFARKASYRWNDVDALPLIRDVLLPKTTFQSEIAGWVNMSYTEFRRPQLKPIADQLARHPEKLEGWAKELLIERRFISESRHVRWEEYVKKSNMRV